MKTGGDSRTVAAILTDQLGHGISQAFEKSFFLYIFKMVSRWMTYLTNVLQSWLDMKSVWLISLSIYWKGSSFSSHQIRSIPFHSVDHPAMRRDGGHRRINPVGFIFGPGSISYIWARITGHTSCGSTLRSGWSTSLWPQTTPSVFKKVDLRSGKRFRMDQ